MIRITKLLLLVMFGAIIAVGLISGCSKFDAGTPNRNLPPETTLSFSPDEGSTANYRVRMNWFGWDVDGEISHFETAWDKPDSVPSWDLWIDMSGLRVVSTDSVFFVTARDSLDESQAYTIHSFGVRAVDNDGAKDSSPESLSFTAATALPVTEIDRGPASTTGPMVTFEWSAWDRDGVIVGYDYRLLRFDSGEWKQVTPNPEEAYSIHVGPEDNEVLFGPLAGAHRFEVWATDDAGAIDPTPATSNFTCNPEFAGGKLTINTNVFGTHTFQGGTWNDSYNTPDPIFIGERLAFWWTATAEDYGGEIVGYRHAYDDTSTWPAWSVFDRRFSVTPDVGRHSLYVSALDNANVITRGRIYFEVIESSLDDYILIVDDYDLYEGLLNKPSDQERSDFYGWMLTGLERERQEWEPSQHLNSGGEPQPPDVLTLSGASTVVWYSDQSNTVLEELFDPFLEGYNALAGYVRVGGNLVMCGWSPIGRIANETYPVTVSDTDTTAALTFIRDFLHIARADESGQSVGDDWGEYGYCFYGAVPTAAGENLGFESVYIDTAPCGSGLPYKWWMYCRTVPTPAYYHAGTTCEVLTPYQSAPLEIFTVDSFKNYNIQGQTCAVLYLSGDNRSNSCYLGFQPYYCQGEPARNMMLTIMELFGERRIQ